MNWIAIAVLRGQAAMRYDGILLDFYGTLVEEDDAIINRIVSIIAERSAQESDPRAIASAWGRLFSDCCARAHGVDYRSQRELEADSLRALLSFYACDLDAEVLSEGLFHYWQAPTSYRETTQFLSTLSVPICIVSNIDRQDLEAAIDCHDWHFEQVVTSECCRAYKPRAEMFEAAVAMLGLPRERLLHIGDSWGSDVVGARQQGLDVAWVNRRDKSPPANTDHHPTVTVQSLTELAALFDQ